MTYARGRADLDPLREPHRAAWTPSWGLLAWRGKSWRMPDTPEAQTADRTPTGGLGSGNHLPLGADMGRPSTYYRLGAEDRVVAYTPPPSPEHRRALAAAQARRVHPLALAAALDLAEGDTSRLVFTKDGQVEVRNAPRGAR